MYRYSNSWHRLHYHGPAGSSSIDHHLVDLAIKTIKAVNSLSRSYYNASAELADLRHQLNGLDSQLVLLRYVQNAVEIDAMMHDDDDLDSLQHF